MALLEQLEPVHSFGHTHVPLTHFPLPILQQLDPHGEPDISGSTQVNFILALSTSYSIVMLVTPIPLRGSPKTRRYQTSPTECSTLDCSYHFYSILHIQNYY